MIRPFFCYYGGKWRDAPKHYPAPTHDLIVEPFAGAAGYALRYPDRDVLLIDTDPVIAGIWAWLVTAEPDEILCLPDIGPDMTIDDLDVRPEAKHLIGFWLNKGSVRSSELIWFGGTA